MLIQLCKFILLFLVLGLIFGGGKNKVDFVMVNGSSQNITHGSIVLVGGSALDQPIEFGEIKIGSSISGRLEIKAAESHYHIKIRFESGEELETEMGYLTPWFDDIDELTITENEVLFTNHESIRTCFIF